MSARIETMRNATQRELPSPQAMLLRKLAMVFLVALIGGVGLSFIGLANRTIAPFAFALASAAGLGLLSGFTSRRALRGHTSALRGAASIAAVIVSMLFVGWVSGEEAGLVLRHPAPATMDTKGLLELAAAAMSAALALSSWKDGRGRTIGEPTAPPAQPPAPPERRSSSRPARRPPAARAGAERSRPPVSTVQPRELVRGLARRFSNWRAGLPMPRLRDLPTPHLPGWLARRRRVGHGLRVRLLGVEEHRCPYCLDVVERADPRGVVTCKVCHTRHHADCWAVTGMCQVPHVHR